jgi:methyl-accepting chemotaxis protein
MSKTAREVSQAMNEQGSAAREIVKAAQNTTAIATQVRRSSKEQSTAAKQVAQAVESIRRSAISSSHAFDEQARASEQVSSETMSLARQIASVSKAMSDQSVSISQVAATTKKMGRLSEQVARGMSEQSRASRDMSTSIDSISKDVRTVTRANRNHLDHSGQVLKGISDIRSVTMQNAVNAQSLANGAAGLTERARRLAELMHRMESGNPSGNHINGNAEKAPRKRTKKVGNSEGA